MNLKLQKWGNSTAVRLPQTLLKEAGFKDGFECAVHVGKKGITLTPVKLSVKKRPMTFQDFVDGITPENLHEFVDWGPPVGKEVW